jgi:phage-related protein
MVDKDIVWMGSLYDDLLEFPKETLKSVGGSLRKVQSWLDPDDWKPFEIIGAGAKEIRVRAQKNQYRVLYIAKFEDGIYVLHCFVKKTEKTSKHDVELGKERYKAMVKWRRENGQGKQ